MHGVGPVLAAGRRTAAAAAAAAAADHRADDGDGAAALAVLDELLRRACTEAAAAVAAEVAAEEDGGGGKAACRAVVRQVAAFGPALAALLRPPVPSSSGAAAVGSVGETCAPKPVLRVLERCEQWFISSAAPAGVGAAVPRVLQLLYEADAVAEEAFLQWWAARRCEHERGAAEAAGSAAMFAAGASRFIEWLIEADEDTSSESSAEEETAAVETALLQPEAEHEPEGR
eukprot:SAG11_NODE_185_length_13160_cov_9.118521_9_plen_230_part_00